MEKEISKCSVAILYQQSIPPAKNGILKPYKPGGYSDSGADIANSLKKSGIKVITSNTNPSTDVDSDWVFPDTREGIESAIKLGADTIWMNTVLHEGHPIESFIQNGIWVVGQDPKGVDIFDDKWETNELLRKNNLPVPRAVQTNASFKSSTLNFPVVVKPFRGRGSQGVVVVNHEVELSDTIEKLLGEGVYGDSLYIEEFLPGDELTFTVMPPGIYSINTTTLEKDEHWSLPAIKRFNHENGVAPYNGVVAVIHNSRVLTVDEEANPQILKAYKECEQAAAIVNAKAPIRIDCRADKDGNYFLFDLNMKPNMTGASRPHRHDQDSLTALAARKIGWSFDDLILNMLAQRWFSPVNRSNASNPQ